MHDTGNNHLGGQDFNERLWRHLSAELERTRGEPLTNPEEIQQLRSLVETAKLRLTEHHSTKLRLTFTGSVGNKPETVLTDLFGFRSN